MFARMFWQLSNKTQHVGVEGEHCYTPITTGSHHGRAPGLFPRTIPLPDLCNNDLQLLMESKS